LALAALALAVFGAYDSYPSGSSVSAARYMYALFKVEMNSDIVLLVGLSRVVKTRSLDMID